MPIKPPSPIFIVGCSRGGTTLLQSIVAQVEGMYATREMDVFYRICDDLEYQQFGPLCGRRRVPSSIVGGLANRLGVTASYSRQPIERFLEALGREDLLPIVPRHAFKIRQIYRAYVEVMSRLAGGGVWVEKTPQNIFCVDLIHKYVPEAVIIHIIRNGPDNVASLVDAGRRYRDFTGRFGGEMGVKRALAYWNSAVRLSRKWIDRNRHYFIRYEDLASHPREAVNLLEGAVPGISCVRPVYDTQSIAAADEVWKHRKSSDITPARSKFDIGLSSEERTYVLRNVLDVDEIFPRVYV